MAAWTGVGLLSASKRIAVPISKFQSDVLRLLADQRSPDSYIAGAIAIKADEAALTAGGYAMTWPPTQRTGKQDATIERRRADAT